MKPAILLILILAVSSCYGKGRHGGGGPGGPDGPPPGNWTGPANCTVPLTLLQAAPDTYATFLKLLNETNATRAYDHPSRFNVTRAPSEAFFAAWFAATGTTQLPDIASYNKTQLHQLRRALIDLMQPLESFLPRNDTGHNDTRPPGGHSGPGGKGPDGQPEPPMGGNRKLLRGGPGGPGGEQGPEESLGGGGGGGQGPAEGGPGPEENEELLGGGDGQGPAEGGQGPPEGRPGADGQDFTEGGQGPPGGGQLPPPPRGCQNATLAQVDAIVEGSAACPLEACLGCAGLASCACVDCKCQCAAS